MGVSSAGRLSIELELVNVLEHRSHCASRICARSFVASACHRASLPPARLCAAVVELDLTKGSAEKSAVRLIDAYEGQCPNDGMDVECHPETWTLSKNICMYTTFRCLRVN